MNQGIGEFDDVNDEVFSLDYSHDWLTESVKKVSIAVFPPLSDGGGSG